VTLEAMRWGCGGRNYTEDFLGCRTSSSLEEEARAVTRNGDISESRTSGRRRLLGVKFTVASRVQAR
jgi:hypothetical protein